MILDCSSSDDIRPDREYAHDYNDISSGKGRPDEMTYGRNRKALKSGDASLAGKSRNKAKRNVREVHSAERRSMKVEANRKRRALSTTASKYNSRINNIADFKSPQLGDFETVKENINSALTENLKTRAHAIASLHGDGKACRDAIEDVSIEWNVTKEEADVDFQSKEMRNVYDQYGDRAQGLPNENVDDENNNDIANDELTAFQEIEEARIGPTGNNPANEANQFQNLLSGLETGSPINETKTRGPSGSMHASIQRYTLRYRSLQLQSDETLNKKGMLIEAICVSRHNEANVIKCMCVLEKNMPNHNLMAGDQICLLFPSKDVTDVFAGGRCIARFPWTLLSNSETSCKFPVFLCHGDVKSASRRNDNDF